MTSPPPLFPSLTPSKQLLIEDLTQAAVNLWGLKRANDISDILEEHAQQLIELSNVMPPSNVTPTMGWQNHP